MKRIYLGIGLSLAILLAGLWASAFLSGALPPVSEKLETASRMALSGDLPGGYDAARDARAQWKKQWFRTAAFADHTPMDEIDADFAMLDAYAQTDSPAAFAARCARLSALIDAAADTHRLTWWNFL